MAAELLRWQPQLQALQGLTYCGCQFDPQTPQLLQARGLSLPPHLLQAVAKRQSEYLAGRWAARHCYQQLGQAWDGLPTTPSGAPLWPPGWRGSLSHTVTTDQQGYALVAMAPQSHCAALGLDLEAPLSTKTAQRVRKVILTAAELSWAEDPLQVGLIFSLKESLYKALNPLLERFIGFDEVELAPFELAELQKQQTLSLNFSPRGQLASDFPTGAPCQGTGQLLPELLITSYCWTLG